MRKPHHVESTAGAIYLGRSRAAGVEPALGLAYDLAPLNRDVLLLVGETSSGTRVCWVERAGMALDVRGPETAQHDDLTAFRESLRLRRPPVALDRRAVRALWRENDERPQLVYAAFEQLLRQ
jgi:hypothetical protein